MTSDKAIDDAVVEDLAKIKLTIRQRGEAPAFAAVAVGPSGDIFSSDGLTKREWFAGMAHTSDLYLPDSIDECAEYIGVAKEDYKASVHWPIAVTKARYAYADAMLKAGAE